MQQNLEKEPHYYLGVDWGESWVGLAIADDEMRISTGLEQVQAKNALERIKQLDAQYNFTKIVLGAPFHEKFGLKQKFEIFASDLQELGKETVLENEAFSSKMAQTNLSQKLKKGISHSDNVEAARLILQGWLDKSLKK